MSGVNFLQDSTEKVNKPPEYNEYEISVFGKGYGESIVLSCGNKNFIIVDSFLNPDTGRPIALDYLDSMNITYDRIKQVVITHWHDDHIKGISRIIQEVGQGIGVVLNPIIEKKVFLDYILKAINEDGNNGVSEFRKVWEYIENNPSYVKLSSVDKRIFSDEENNTAELYGLAPQDSEILDYINTYIKKYIADSATAPYYRSDNALSLVLLLKKNKDGALLGGDLENSKDNTQGWDAIVNNYSHTSTHPSIYKVPHHGSVTGFNEKIWTEILGEDPVSVMTFFNRGEKLPRDEEVLRITKLSKKVYILGGAQKDKELKRKVEKSARRIKFESTKSVVGMFRYRKCMDDEEESIECFGHVVVREGDTTE